MYKVGNPSQLIIVRHAESELNVLLQDIVNDPEFRKLKELLRTNPYSGVVRKIAEKLRQKYAGRMVADYLVGLTAEGERQALKTGAKLGQIIEPSEINVIFVSPYARALQTLEKLKETWPKLNNVRTSSVFVEDALREQEMGLAHTYGSFVLFFALNDQDRNMYYVDAYAPYFYRFPNGESVADLRARVNSWYDRVMLEHRGRTVLVVSHGRTISAIRARIENWSSQRFIDEHVDGKVHNCGVSIYRDIKQQRGMELVDFNMKLWD